MYVILGASGHIGSVVIDALRASGEKVIAVAHSADKAAAIARDGIEPVVADVTDTGQLRSILQKGRRAFLLNPPADIKGDTNAGELKTASSIAAHLKDPGWRSSSWCPPMERLMAPASAISRCCTNSNAS